MNSNSKDYRRHAAICLLFGESASDPGARVGLLKMAQVWEHLAAQADRNSKLDLVYEPPLSRPANKED